MLGQNNGGLGNFASSTKKKNAAGRGEAHQSFSLPLST